MAGLTFASLVERIRGSYSLASVLLCALLASCATNPPPSADYLRYTDQIELNTQRYQACTSAQARRYAASGKLSNDKIVSAALKQCKVYGTNICHAQIERDALDQPPTVATLEWRNERKAACRASLDAGVSQDLLQQLDAAH